MKKAKLNRHLRQELAALQALPDEAIDTFDIPELDEAFWIDARRGDFYKPKKQPVTMRIDSDVLNFFKQRAAEGKYQSEINRVLRAHVGAELHGKAKATPDTSVRYWSRKLGVTQKTIRNMVEKTQMPLTSIATVLSMAGEDKKRG